MTTTVTSGSKRAPAAEPGVPFGEVIPPSTIKPMISNKTPSTTAVGPSSATAAAAAAATTSSTRNCVFPRRLSRAAEVSYHNGVSKIDARGPLPPAAIAADAAATTRATTRKTRGIPLVQWVWPSNTGAWSAMSKTGGSVAAEERRRGQENPAMTHQQQQQQQQQHTAVSSVVTGKVCEPVRPTRLDLAATQGRHKGCCWHGSAIHWWFNRYHSCRPGNVFFVGEIFWKLGLVYHNHHHHVVVVQFFHPNGILG